jgi:hypothetical protein
MNVTKILTLVNNGAMTVPGDFRPDAGDGPDRYQQE